MLTPSLCPSSPPSVCQEEPITFCEEAFVSHYRSGAMRQFLQNATQLQLFKQVRGPCPGSEGVGGLLRRAHWVPRPQPKAALGLGRWIG